MKSPNTIKNRSITSSKTDSESRSSEHADILLALERLAENHGREFLKQYETDVAKPALEALERLHKAGFDFNKIPARLTTLAGTSAIRKPDRPESIRHLYNCNFAAEFRAPYSIGNPDTPVIIDGPSPHPTIPPTKVSCSYADKNVGELNVAAQVGNSSFGLVEGSGSWMFGKLNRAWAEITQVVSCPTSSGTAIGLLTDYVVEIDLVAGGELDHPYGFNVGDTSKGGGGAAALASAFAIVQVASVTGFAKYQFLNSTSAAGDRFQRNFTLRVTVRAAGNAPKLDIGIRAEVSALVSGIGGHQGWAGIRFVSYGSGIPPEAPPTSIYNTGAIKIEEIRVSRCPVDLTVLN